MKNIATRYFALFSLLVLGILPSYGQAPFDNLHKDEEFLKLLNEVRQHIRRSPNSEHQALELLESSEALSIFLKEYIKEHGSDNAQIQDFLESDDQMNDYLHYEDHNHDYPNTVYDGPQPIEEDQLNEKASLRLAKCENSSYFFENWNNHGLFLSYESYTNLPDKLVIPLNHFKASYYNSFNSGFGLRWGGKMHMGIDMGLSVGAPIYAAFDGKVRYAKFNTGGYGNLVVIRHCNGLETYYAHLNSISVSPNDMVYAGQVIGTGGSTGRSSGPHLHFEVRYREFAFDPMLFIDENTFELKTDTLILTREDFHTRRWRGDSGYSGPSKYTTKKEEKFHTVQDGETPYSIAQSQNITVEELLFLNGIHNVDRIFPGQKLKVE